MSRKNGLFILATAAVTSFFSISAFADTAPEIESSFPVTISSINAQIKELELRKRAYDTEAERLGASAHRLQFEDFLLARQLYSQQRQLQYRSEALQLEIDELKKKKAAMQKR